MPKNFTDLSGKVAVVIGGTSGIGKSMALGFAAAGADVVPTGRREANVAEVCELVRAEGRETLAHTVDVADRASIDSLRDAVVAKFGRVDILLNVAGRIKRTPTKDISEEEWTGIIDTNLTGTLRACQAFYEALKISGKGRIINIASLNSYVAFYEVAAYAASKSAVLSLTRSLAVQFAGRGVRSNSISPGPVETPLLMEWLLKDEAAKQLRLARNPTGRFGKPEEVVSAAIYLASDESRWTNGANFVIDGGISVNYF